MATNVQPITLDTNAYVENAYKELSSMYPDTNIFALPRVDKVVINVGVGKYDNKQKQDIADYLTKLTSQTPKKVMSKVSIASFKVRKGDIVGLVVTLRGKKAMDFLLHLVYIALPRTRDFRGIKSASFDKNNSCYSLGIENVSIFPAIGFDTTVDFGMQINVSFKESNPGNKALLQKLSFPFKKD
jgi:large subunit ribosomal protein L5